TNQTAGSSYKKTDYQSSYAGSSYRSRPYTHGFYRAPWLNKSLLFYPFRLAHEALTQQNKRLPALALWAAILLGIPILGSLIWSVVSFIVKGVVALIILGVILHWLNKSKTHSL
ncbi:MAG: hypothetical protein OWS74_07215, partial [Firmicutes bacterium]|nr:hypothetical protein [Bacillota bacterium]